jgi:hypothetical protein
MLSRTLKRVLFVAGCSGAFLFSSGCHKESEPSPPPPTSQQTIDVADNGRFQLVSTNEGLALDTKTGLLCETTISNNKQLPFCLDLLMDTDTVVNRIMEARKAGTGGER